MQSSFATGVHKGWNICSSPKSRIVDPPVTRPNGKRPNRHRLKRIKQLIRRKGSADGMKTDEHAAVWKGNYTKQTLRG